MAYTLVSYKQTLSAGVYIAEFRGRSTDTDPTDVPGFGALGDGSTKFDMDTGKAYMYNGTSQAWVEL